MDYIIPDATFTNVVEDLSGVTEEMSENARGIWSDGRRKVSFCCNGKAYEKELESYGEWINMEILDCVNQALKENGCAGKLHVVANGSVDQMLVLLYGSREYANSVRRAIGAEEEKEEEAEPNFIQRVLDFLF